jgi:phage terminase large subunit
MVTTPTFDIKLHPAQALVFNDPARFKVMVCGRRFGKTQGLKAEIIKEAFTNPRSVVWYVAPTYKQAKRLMWTELKQAIPPSFIKKKSEVELILELWNGSSISLFGVDKPDGLRGSGINLLCMDEYQDFKPEIFEKVLYPTLTDRRGRVVVAGTPKSFNLLYDLYMRGYDREWKKHGWKSWQFVTADNPFIPRDEIEAARRNLDRKSFEQEYMASFETMQGKVYYAFDRKIHAKNFLPFNPTLPIWIGQDFNIDPMSTVILQPQPNGQIWVVDELNLKNASTHEVAEALENKFFRPELKKLIEIYPDPAGSARGHTRGESDLDILRQQGFRKIFYKRKHPLVADRINSVNRMFMTASGETRLYVSSHCKELIKSLEQTIYKEGSREVNKKLGTEHMADALGYPIEFRFPVVKKQYYGVSR